MKQEIIKNIDAVYSVSSEGRFFKNGKEVKGWVNGKGYREVRMYGKIHKLHRLVAQAFIPNPAGKPYIDHINTIKTDNRVENLRWVTHKENCNNPLTRMHMSEWVRTEEYRKKLSEAQKGEKNHLYGKHLSEETRKKMSNSQQKKPVLQYTKQGEFVKEWRSAREVERHLGYDNSHINKCCLNKYKSSYGYIWKYKEAV